MARTATYLNFAHSTEEAFLFYKSVFGTEFSGPIHRFKDAPPMPGAPPLSKETGELVMHIELPILGGHMLMGTDAPQEMGIVVVEGNNVQLNLEPDTRAEADGLFSALSVGGTVQMPIAEMFWGAYFGSLTDRFGIRWMVNCVSKT